jgi:hypothetical protein
MDDYNAIIKSHTGFQPLEEVWVGDCYPMSFSEAIAEQHRDLFHKVNEATTQDLNQLVKKLKELDVIVRRPEFNSINHYIDYNDNLLKPPITPRDWAFHNIIIIKKLNHSNLLSIFIKKIIKKLRFLIEVFLKTCVG